MSIDFPDDYRERELRLLVLRLQHERLVAGEVSALVERTLNQVLDRLLSSTYRDISAYQRARLNTLYAELDRIIHTGYTRVSDDLVQRMKGYAQLESDVARATVNAVLQAGGGELSVSFYRLPKAYLEGIAKLPIQGLRIGEWFEGQATSMSLNTKRIIQQGLIEGKGPADIARRILAPDRVMGPTLPPALSRRAKNEATTIARTSVNAVQNDATKQSYSQLPRSVSDSYMWMSVNDSRTSLICAALDGRVWKYDDPDGRVPPAHPNCVLGDTHVAPGGDIAAVSKRWVECEAVVIRTASGHELTCTPNHPILTRRGWAAAQSLRLGDEVVCDRFGKRPAMVDGDVEGVPTRIEEVAEAWLESRGVLAVTVPLATPDFHGDAVEGEVAVIGTDRLLLHERHASRLEHRGEPEFDAGCPRTRLLSPARGGDQVLDRHLAPSDSVVRSLGELAALVGGGTLHAGDLLRATVACGDAILPENAPYHVPGTSELLADPAETNASVEQSNSARRIDVVAQPSAAGFDHHPSFTQAAPDHGSAHRDGVGNRLEILSTPVASDAILDVEENRSTDAAPASSQLFADSVGRSAVQSSEVLDRFAASVAFDQVVALNRREFAGHVYNLETEFGFYSANGIITHNCRSTTRALIKGLDVDAASGQTKPSTLRSYSDWLTTQPESVQNDILGPTRAGFWRDGKMSLADAIDQDNRVLTLPQLRTKLGLDSVVHQ